MDNLPFSPVNKFKGGLNGRLVEWLTVLAWATRSKKLAAIFFSFFFVTSIARLRALRYQARLKTELRALPPLPFPFQPLAAAIQQPWVSDPSSVWINVNSAD